MKVNNACSVFNRIVNDTLSNTFSMTDLDAVVRCNCNDGVRLILAETKRLNEKYREPQKITLNMLANSIDWSKYLPHSGACIIRETEPEFNKMDILDLDENILVGGVDMDYIERWFACKDLRNVGN